MILLGGKYNFFSKLDMKSGFWQIPIKEKDKYKTAFITPHELYEWNVLAQGLKNSPLSFQRIMMNVFSSCCQFALVYTDNIVVYSHSFEEHLDHMQHILSILLKNNFQLNPTKPNIFRHQIDYLSHTMSQQGFHITQHLYHHKETKKEKKTKEEREKDIIIMYPGRKTRL